MKETTTIFVNRPEADDIKVEVTLKMSYDDGEVGSLSNPAGYEHEYLGHTCEQFPKLELTEKEIELAAETIIETL